MTPEQKLKHLVLLKHFSFGGDAEEITAENVDEVYARIEEDDGDGFGLQDARSEVRGGEVETGIKAPYSRHYEAKSVAAKYIDGTWLGWTYWYGGGKHGEPEEVEWIDEAYELTCTEEEKMVVVRNFALAKEPA